MTGVRLRQPAELPSHVSFMGTFEQVLTQPRFKPINREDGVTDTSAKV